MQLDPFPVTVPIRLLVGDNVVELGEIATTARPGDDGVVTLVPDDGRTTEQHVAEALVITAAKLLDPDGRPHDGEVPGGDDPDAPGHPCTPTQHAEEASADAASGD